MPGLSFALSLTGAALLATTVAAQTAAPPDAPSTSQPASLAAPAPLAAPALAPDAPAPACELHIWPSTTVSATTQGAGMAFGIVGALVDTAAHADKNKRDTAFITGTLDAQAQARVLRDLDLPSRLHLPPSQIIVHEESPVANHESAKRLSDSTAPCYTEFVVRGLLYFQSMLYRGQMRTFLEARRFDGPKVVYDFRDSKHEDLTVTLPKEGDDTGPATDALLSAFKGDVAFFADKVARKYK